MVKTQGRQNLLARIMALLLAIILMVPAWLPQAAAAETTAEQLPEAVNGLLPEQAFIIQGTTLTGLDQAYLKELLINGSGKYTKVVIPDSVKTIAGSTGTGNNKTGGVFEGAVKITELVIPDGVQTIGEGAFLGCTGLKSLTIPGSITTIGPGAFAYCTSLEEVSILYGVQTIGDSAFANCTSLKRINISPSVQEMPAHVLDQTSKVQVGSVSGSAAEEFIKRVNTSGGSSPVLSTSLPADSAVVYDYTLDSQGYVTIEGYYGDNKQPVIPNVIHGHQVTGIGNEAFHKGSETKPGQNCNITTVTFPDTLRTIGTNAFAGCDKLQTVTIPDSVTGIGDGAFAGSTAIIKSGSDAVLEWASKHPEINVEMIWKPGTSLYKQITVEVRPAGAAQSISPTPGKHVFRRGSQVDLSTVPKPTNGDQLGYRFTGWTLEAQTVNADGSQKLNELIDTPSLTKATLTIPDYDLTLVANFIKVDKEPLIIKEIGGKGTVLQYTGIVDKNGIPQKTLVIEDTYTETLSDGTKHTFEVVQIGHNSYNNGVVFLDTNMEALSIGPKITEILPQAFDAATGLKEIIVRDRDINSDGKVTLSKIPENGYYTKDGVLFQKLSNGVKLVTYPKAKGDNYTLPAEVTEIGEKAFFNCTGLTTLTIPQGSKLSRIGKYAFASSGLKAIDIPASVTEIESYAFYKSQLASVKWADNCQIKTINPYVFAATQLTEAILPSSAPDSVTISDYAYAYCQNIKKVIITPAIKELQSSAFMGCANLEAYEIQTGTTNNKYATQDGVLFSHDMTVLMSYPIAKTLPAAANNHYQVPASVKTLDKGSLSYAKFQKITLNNVTKIDDTALAYTPITEIDLSKVTELGNYVFQGCKNLQKVALPSTITKVPMYTFKDCRSLVFVSLPQNLTVIDNNAFDGCASLQAADIRTIDEFNNNDTTNAKLPTGLTHIGQFAFRRCLVLESAVLPDSLEYIGAYAYMYCNKLKEISIPAKVKFLGHEDCKTEMNQKGTYAFTGCAALETVTCKAAVIEAGTFLACGKLTTLTLDNAVQTISDKAFQSCGSLTALATQATSIGAEAFADDIALASADLPAVTSIKEAAFSGCSALSALTLGAVQNIADKAFYQCHALTKLQLPASIQTIGERAFTTCEKLESITIGADGNSTNNVFFTRDGILYCHINNEVELFQYPQNLAPANNGTSFTVGTDVTRIHAYAFESNNYLTTVDFPASVKQFGHSLFYGSDKIGQIYIRDNSGPASPTFDMLSKKADQVIFYGIPDNVASKLLVYGYPGTNTEKIVMQCAVKKIKFISLQDFSEGLMVRVYAIVDGKETDNVNTAQDLYGEVIGYEPTTTAEPALVVPGVITRQLWLGSGNTDTTKPRIKLVKQTSTTTNEAFTLNEGQMITVTRLAKNAFQNPKNKESVRSLTAITLPQTIKEIKMLAFENCSALSTLILPESLTTIEQNAFQGCTALTKMTIPASVTMMGTDEVFDQENTVTPRNNAFQGATGLQSIEVAPGNKKYSSVEGVLFNKDQSILLEMPARYKDGATAYTIPNKVKRISSSAFRGNLNLNTVTIPTSVKSIGVSAFEDCFPSLAATVTFVQSTDKKDGQEGGLDLENRAFANCKYLTKITLPWYTDRLGDDVFTGCSSLQAFEMHPKPAGAGDTSVAVVNGVLYGYVQKGNEQNYALYKYPAGLQATSYAIDTTIPVMQIYKSAFQDNKNLTSVTLSDSVRIIQESAFRNAEKLKTVDWKNVQRIDGKAFANTALENAELPSTVDYLGQEAFADCKALKSVTVPYLKTEFGTDVFKNHVADFVLKGHSNSTASTYATANNLKFESLTGGATYQVSIDDAAKSWISFDTTAESEKYTQQFTQGDAVTIKVNTFSNADNKLTSVRFTPLVPEISDGMSYTGPTDATILDISNATANNTLSFTMPNANLSVSVVLVPVNDAALTKLTPDTVDTEKQQVNTSQNATEGTSANKIPTGRLDSSSSSYNSSSSGSSGSGSTSGTTSTPSSPTTSTGPSDSF